MKTKNELKGCDPGNESRASLRLTFRQPKTEPCPRQHPRCSKSIESSVEGAWRDVKKAKTACEYLNFFVHSSFGVGRELQIGNTQARKGTEKMAG
jgi:hypothetical protein